MTLDPLALSEQSERSRRELTKLARDLTLSSDERQIVRGLDSVEEAVEQEAAHVRGDLQRADRWAASADTRFRFVRSSRTVEASRPPIAVASARVARAMKRIAELRDEWMHVVELLRSHSAAAELQDDARALAADTERLLLVGRRSQAQLARAAAQLHDIEASIEATVEEAQADLLAQGFGLERSGTPLRALLVLFEPGRLLQALQDGMSQHQSALYGFARAYPARLVFHGLLMLATAYLLRWVRGQRQKPERPSLVSRLLVPPPTPELAQSRELALEHPIAGALLLTALATLPLYPALPVAVSLAALGTAVGASAAILVAERAGSRADLAVAVVALTVVFAVAVAFSSLPEVSILLTGPLGLVVAFVGWLTAFRQPLRAEGAWRALAALLGRFWLGLAGLALVLWAAGYTRVAGTLVGGSGRAILLTVAFHAGYGVAQSLLGLLLDSPLLGKLNAVRDYRELLRTRLSGALRLLMVLFWARSVLASYALWRPLYRALESALAHSFTFGSLAFTAADVLSMSLTLAAAIITAKVVRFILDEDALPRTSLRVGTRAALSSGAYYLILAVGLVLAIASTGMKLDQLTIVVSAVGVGIGFGMQNLVQNFVSGLILLFGRPINVADVVQVGELTGRVTKVGVRASTVRTFQGAEVIVPNSAFVAETVVNWSLSDETRRVDLDLGVAYGSDPEQVIALLLGVARAHPEVLAHPEPEVLFTAFGDSALNFQLRAFTGSGPRWANLKSDLGVAAYRALREAGIVIPFPQRDVHVRSLPPAAPR